MPLPRGTTLAQFEVVSSLGAGGMGEVYRARDTRLGREVAIKLLLSEVAGDPERLARFEREARVLASLNHSNVATLFGFESAGDSSFLVMELVEGETLAERIARGRIPPAEAIPIFLRIADGLEAAHEKAIVHRDLKPANVKLTPDGGVKILDFGLAKALTPEGHARPGVSQSDSPTLTELGTRQGVVLGTAAYMAPEQVKGAEADRRADVWAFGACLFEALAGRRAFRGRDATEVMAATLTLEPAWSALPEVAPSLRRLLARCLTKDPRKRLHDIADARLELEEAQSEDGTSRIPGEPGKRPRWLAPALAGAGGLLLGALLFAGLGGRGDATDRVAAPVRLRATQIPLLPGKPLYSEGRQIAISPDGEEIVFAAGEATDTHLYRRRLESFEVEEIPGTEGGRNPFFSPDGLWLAFVDDEHLKKVSMTGGEVQVLCEAAVSTSPGAWTDDGWIYFTYDELTLARVREEGGTRQPFLDVDILSLAPLPGGRVLVVTHVLEGWDRSFAPILVADSDGEVREVLRGHSATWLAAPGSSRGHLLFVRGDELLAAPFDVEGLEVLGEAKRVRGGLWTDSIWGWARYAVSADGTLVYVPGTDYARTVPTWIDRVTGAEEPLRGLAPGVRNVFELSPDDTRLVFQASAERDQIEVFDLGLQTTTRLSRDGGIAPVWSHDGSEIFYETTRGPLSIVRARADRSREPVTIPIPAIAETPTGRPVPPGKDWMDPTSVSPDGKLLVTQRFGPDIWLVPLDGGEPAPLLATPYADILGVVSPDGRWIVYQSNEAGDYAIYVAPFPSVEWSRRVSTGRGDDPRWSPVGGELFYRDYTRIYRVAYSATDTEFIPEAAERVLDVDFHNAIGLSFDVSRDGKRFLVQKPAISLFDDRPVVVIEGWQAELERLVPAG